MTTNDAAAPLRDALRGLAIYRGGTPCWCESEPITRHTMECDAARRALDEVEG
jgi:hypothetical protein